MPAVPKAGQFSGLAPDQSPSTFSFPPNPRPTRELLRWEIPPLPLHPAGRGKGRKKLNYGCRVTDAGSFSLSTSNFDITMVGTIVYDASNRANH